MLFFGQHGQTWVFTQSWPGSKRTGKMSRPADPGGNSQINLSLSLCQQEAAVRDMIVFLETSEEALECLKSLKEMLTLTGFQLRNDVPLQSHRLGSAPLQQVWPLDECSRDAGVGHEEDDVNSCSSVHCWCCRTNVVLQVFVQQKRWLPLLYLTIAGGGGGGARCSHAEACVSACKQFRLCKQTDRAAQARYDLMLCPRGNSSTRASYAKCFHYFNFYNDAIYKIAI